MGVFDVASRPAANRVYAARKAAVNRHFAFGGILKVH